MKAQTSLLVTASLIISVMIFGVVCTESYATAQENQRGLRQIVTDLQHQVADLKTTVQSQAAAIRTLQSQLQAQQGTLDRIDNTVREHAGKLQFVTVEGTEMYITGANLNIRDGSGATSGTIGQYRVANP